jgi:hypothetical protein
MCYNIKHVEKTSVKVVDVNDVCLYNMPCSSCFVRKPLVKCSLVLV